MYVGLHIYNLKIRFQINKWHYRGLFDEGQEPTCASVLVLELGAW